MYSYKDRLKAVKLYIKYNLNIATREATTFADRLKSHVVNPAFYRFVVSAKRF